MEITVFHVAAVAALLIVAALLLLVLFEPGLAYRICSELPDSGAGESLRLVAALVDAPVCAGNMIRVLTNGGEFYKEELAAILSARRSIHLEAYIFHPSRIAERFVDALTERASHGVEVRIVIDAIGSMRTPDSYFARLREAGGTVKWYQQVRWHTLKRFNNRTHRELLIVDGHTGFVGGAGIASWWSEGGGGSPWRDTMVRVSGSLAGALQSSFLENWLETTGEILVNTKDFAGSDHAECGAEDHDLHGFVVSSTPSAGKATRARILFQVLVASAHESIMISTPYFLPDAGMMRELAQAVARGVLVKVIVPNRLNNHPMVRRASRRRYGALLGAGVRLFEYEPAMMHAKVLVVDCVWSVLGTTNFDNRSFALNDEVNIALHDSRVAERLQRDFQADLLSSREVNESDIQRGFGERFLARLERLAERQQ